MLPGLRQFFYILISFFNCIGSISKISFHSDREIKLLGSHSGLDLDCFLKGPKTLMFNSNDELKCGCTIRGQEKETRIVVIRRRDSQV